ncbi:VapC toxin family PIN domain ribonuclease [Alkalilimnicola ehrlichii]|uniref:Ribonuclease VapC n=1 Tax=Alkalilimnicola ehrlichii TaxID=351052 RepID=A0A3E0WLE3_9GAMM|nr:type II toxin-antitoxin system VapC family toxin [Alkalilimnicola ehrlichii]RFA26591.1 VapC toxin family PIN domain ribonuclease [Alkalilimnicola ehrlichii]RFA32907.1 VapC toxin family PIN domain ribonuclease [Alkalilimnicola ehrlichii]
MRYMLDTNICIYVMKHKPASVAERLQTVSVDDVALSAVVLAELRYGIAKSQYRERSQAALEEFLAFVRVLDWPAVAADAYGEIRAELTASGQIIGGNDLLIAAHARCLGATLVTNNNRGFARVPGLSVENWAE